MAPSAKKKMKTLQHKSKTPSARTIRRNASQRKRFLQLAESSDTDGGISFERRLLSSPQLLTVIRHYNSFIIDELIKFKVNNIL